MNPSEAILIKAEVPASEIIAYKNDRKEHEIIVDARLVQIVGTWTGIEMTEPPTDTTPLRPIYTKDGTKIEQQIQVVCTEAERLGRMLAPNVAKGNTEKPINVGLSEIFADQAEYNHKIFVAQIEYLLTRFELDRQYYRYENFGYGADAPENLTDILSKYFYYDETKKRRNRRRKQIANNPTTEQQFQVVCAEAMHLGRMAAPPIHESYTDVLINIGLSEATAYQSGYDHADFLNKIGHLLSLLKLDIKKNSVNGLVKVFNTLFKYDKIKRRNKQIANIRGRYVEPSYESTCYISESYE